MLYDFVKFIYRRFDLYIAKKSPLDASTIRSGFCPGRVGSSSGIGKRNEY